MAEDPVNPPSSAFEGSFPDIPGYRIEETLGRGATGVVFRATQLAVDRQVAIKVLHPHVAKRHKAVRRLQREARTAARLSHPNIVGAIDMGQTGKLWWYAMELVDGCSLADRLKEKGPLTEREALRLFIPLVEALNHAYEHSVVHRDIKPANILLDSSGPARLVDLGLAVTEDDPLLTKQGGTLGTPHYVSPEQARNPQAVDARSDIWSLGATLYHAVCGHPPFSGASVAEILSQVLYARVQDPCELQPKLSKDFGLVLRKCLSRNPERRYQNPAELLDDLERIRERRHVDVQRSKLDPVLRRENRTRRILLATAGVLALVSGAAFLLNGGWTGLGKELDAVGETAETWDELEAVALRAQQADILQAVALTELEELGPPPERFRPRYDQVRASLQRSWRAAQIRALASIRADVDRLLAEGDFASAQALVGDQLEERLRVTLNPSVVQMRDVLARFPREELQRRVEDRLDSAVAALGTAITSHYERKVFVEVDNRRDAGAWSDARALLERDPMDVLAEAGLSTDGLPEERVGALLRKTRDDVARRRTDLEERWKSLDRELEGFVTDEAARIERRLRDRLQQEPADQALAAALEERLTSLRIAPDQRLADVSDRMGRQLRQRTAELGPSSRRSCSRRTPPTGSSAGATTWRSSGCCATTRGCARAGRRRAGRSGSRRCTRRSTSSCSPRGYSRSSSSAPPPACASSTARPASC